MAVIAIDLGATVAKAAVFDGSRMLSAVHQHYSCNSPQDGWAEQDPEAVWQFVDAGVRRALQEAGRPRIAAICVATRGDTVIPMDAHGCALHPAIPGMDVRSHREARDLEERFGRGQLYAATGMPCHPGNAIARILWLQRNCPELRARIWKYVHYEEYLLAKIAGVPAIDFTLASRSGAFHPVRKEWVPSILEFVGVTPAQLGNLSATGLPVGIVRNSIGDAWGIDRHALVVTGGHNQCLAAVGAGVIESELACYSMGMVEAISTSMDTPQMTPAMLDANYPCYCHAVPGRYLTATLNQSGELSLRWCASVLNGTFEDMLRGVQAAPSPVLFMPHLLGSGTPNCDRLSRGSLLGLSVRTAPQDVFQAAVDAMAFEARLNLNRLEEVGVPVTELRAIGAGVMSQALLELKATVLNRPICLLENPEAALVGAAMLGQIAVGTFADVNDARSECVHIARTVEPCLNAVDAYSEAFERYRQLYGVLRSFYHNWAAGGCPTTAVV